jgi:hypothetical protein
MVLVKLIEMIGEDTKSAQLSSIKLGVFFVLYFNTGFLLLLSGANFSGVPIL